MGSWFPEETHLHQGTHFKLQCPSGPFGLLVARDEQRKEAWQEKLPRAGWGRQGCCPPRAAGTQMVALGSSYLLLMAPWSVQLLQPIPHTGWLADSRTVFLTVLKPGCPGECPLSGRTLQISPCVLTWQKEGALWGPFSQGTDPLHEGSTLMPSQPPKAPLPNPITLRVRAPTQEFGGTQIFSPSRMEWSNVAAEA